MGVLLNISLLLIQCVLSVGSAELDGISVGHNENEDTLMELFPQMEFDSSGEQIDSSTQASVTQDDVLVGDSHVAEETREVRKKFMEEALGDEKFTKMKAYLRAIKENSTSENMTTPNDALMIAEQLKSVDRSRNRNVVKSPPTIANINEPIKDLLIGGDLLLTNDQIDPGTREKQDSGASTSGRRKRQVQRGWGFRARNKWNPNIAVSYMIDGTIDDNTKRLIRLSADFWTAHTCITFVENGPTRPTIHFFKGQGCYSEVGKSFRAYTQDISIGQGCEIVGCRILFNLIKVKVKFGTITHEMGHALGFFHHQARTDRDGSLTILYANIESGWWPQYAKEMNTDNEGVDYDWGSIMHYTGYKPHTDTIEMLATDKRYQHTMGNNYGPVFSDLLAINKYYNCMSRCAGGPECKNDGFRDSRNCNACICPNGFGGADCSERAPGEGGAPQDCGETVQAEEVYKFINGSVSPVYVEGRNISDRSAGCHFHIQAPAGKRIEVELVVITGTCSNDCYFGALEIKFDDFRKGGVRMCCDSHKVEVGKLISRTNLVILSLYTQRDERIFSIRYRIYDDPTATTINPDSSTIASNPRIIDDALAPVALLSSSSAPPTSTSNSNCINLSGGRCFGWMIKRHCQWKRRTQEQCRQFCGLC